VGGSVRNQRGRNGSRPGQPFPRRPRHRPRPLRRGRRLLRSVGCDERPDGYQVLCCHDAPLLGNDARRAQRSRRRREGARTSHQRALCRRGEFLVGGVEVDRERECGARPRPVAPKERSGRTVIGEERELEMIDSSTARLAHPTGRVRGRLVQGRVPDDRRYGGSLAKRSRGWVGDLERGGIGSLRHLDLEVTVGRSVVAQPARPTQSRA
jgi:hypothetical protein